MKTTFKTLSLVLGLTTSIVMSPRSIAKQSGNGEGYNGPTLAPDAVVMSVDKPVMGKKMNNILSSCFINKDQDNFSEVFFKPIYNKIDTRLSRLFADSVSIYSDRIVVFNFYHAFLSAEYKNKSTDPIGLQVTIDSRGFLFVEQRDGNGNLIRKLKISNFPIFKTKAKEIATYDPITGDYTGQDIMLENLQVIYDFRNAPAYVQARNVTDGKDSPTQLMAPVADFTNCVIEGLGKL